MQHFCQSRLSSRGPLIAVIKIEIDSQRTDRIFLHQHDDDHKLAAEFVEKHGLNPTLIQHIYDRISFSRSSVQNNRSPVPIYPSPSPFNYPPQQQQPSGFHLHTPIQDLFSHRDEPVYEEEQSFGNLPVKTIKQADRINDYPNYFQAMPEELLTRNKNAKLEKAGEYHNEAPAKKKREFLFYDNEEDIQPEPARQLAVNLFPEAPYVSKQSLRSEPRDSEFLGSSIQSQKKSKVQQILQRKEEPQQRMRGSQSMTKLKYNETINRREALNPSMVQQTTNRTVKPQSFAKPTHVKIIKKQELASLNQSMKRSLSKQDISRINKDVTRRLYNQAEIKKNYLNIIKEKAKKERQITEDKELTHRPELNKISKAIAEGRKKSDMPVQMYLIEEGKKWDNKRQQEASRQYLKEIENCSFQPQLNLISQKLAADKVKIQSRISQNKSRKGNDQNLFKPSLNPVTYELMRDKGTFEERQREYEDLKNTKLMQLVKEKRFFEKIDPESGQQLFKPKINDMGVRQSQGANIGNYLHSLGKENPTPQEGYKLKINQSSEHLVQQMYSKRIGWLFAQLDSNQDGLISAKNIDISTISPEILNIIKPILFEMEELGQQLSLLDFKNAVDILHRKLNAFDKSILYNYKQKPIKGVST